MEVLVHPNQARRHHGHAARSMCYPDDVSMTLRFLSAAPSSRIGGTVSDPHVLLELPNYIFEFSFWADGHWNARVFRCASRLAVEFAATVITWVMN
jgi:hypothetical protein